ncbi:MULTISPECIES: Cof-type HAD-IIB family hydrolase [Enterococcus]|uniref:Cof-type HAD-IIB family hydrolase n=1 Tax=Enterococcus mundtii TaxID=53346 RepID=A0A1A6GDA0_ENTMU|nr:MULTISPECIES: Cof-type HAD-IIB family hydrolase [Enterococcus]GEN19759.1 haloacid dehalogenase [Ligilactobacillus acidipiscis]AUB53399.1 HAD family hydrolase [Enterococcus mundtii]MBO1084851.1 Cof-type HAD-IIB family hydrolase [Enterococcus mundtii]MCA6773061.1 Cof-type HAD-IIB family hydrolase [Enterococcus mundtii]MDB7101784.1 Cof-type HAD-IIB family hydrolase [Enterococcus mundtii]
MIKLIASDMDGTLLDAHMSISTENTEAIRMANELGIEFMVATGRNAQEARAALDEAGIDCAMITLNGAQVFDRSGKSLFTVPIPSPQAMTVMDILDANGIYYEVATNQGLYSESQPKRIESFASSIATHMPHLTYKMAIAMASANLELLHITYVDSIRELLLDDKLEVLKIICFHTEGPRILGPVGKEISNLGELAVTSSGQNNLEVNHKNAQKGIAVAHVAHERGITLDEVMTIGDNFNDVSMLQTAGVSFAMGNAEIEVKDYAKYLTDTNLESGVGKAILRAINENL